MGNEEITKQSETLELICKHCGNRLEPRKFEYDDRLLWGIFDNCEPFDKQMLHNSLIEAIQAFNYNPELEIQSLIEKYTHG